MTRVKICGITNLEDAQQAVDVGADALGFVFYNKSPRYITPEAALEIVKHLPPFVEKVGLFVNASSEEVNLTCKRAKMTLAQIHFEAPLSFYDALEVPHIKVIRATCKEDLLKYKDEYRLVDAFVEGYGGAGKRVDILWFDGIDCSKIILAGGLDPLNVSDMKCFDFYGFDVSSGVEAQKGKKDYNKVAEFIFRAKN